MAKITYQDSAIKGIQNLITHLQKPIDFELAKESRFKVIIAGKQKCLDALFNLLETTKLKEDYAKRVSDALVDLDVETLKIISHDFYIPTKDEIKKLLSSGEITDAEIKNLNTDEMLGNIADAIKIANGMHFTIGKVKDRLNKKTEALIDENIERKPYLLEKYIKNVQHQY